MLAPPPKESFGDVSVIPYGYEEYLSRKGDGSNLLRTTRIAQPLALRRGDILANGDRVLATPQNGFNGSVWVLLSGGRNGHWIKMAPRLPIALLVEADDAPKGIICVEQY